MVALTRLFIFIVAWFLICRSYFAYQVRPLSMLQMSRTKHFLRSGNQFLGGRRFLGIRSLSTSCDGSDRWHTQLHSVSPLIASVAVDSEIIDFMDMKRSHRKTRLLLTPKVVPTLANLRRAIGKKFFALTNQDYKLRYRISRSTDTDLKPMKDDLDLANAVRTCEEMQSSIQLFVVVNPGVFPPVSVAPSATTMQGIASEGEMDINSNSNNSRAFSKLHPAVLAMRAARLDPAESVGYVMVSFYGFHSIGDPRDFAHKLGRLWKPFQPLGRVYVAKEGVNAQMAVPDNVLRYFEETTCSLPVFAKMRLNTDDCVSRTVYEERKPFRALHVRPRRQILVDGFDPTSTTSTCSGSGSDSSDIDDTDAGSAGKVKGNTGPSVSVELDWSQAGQEMHPLEWHRRLSRYSEQKQPVNEQNRSAAENSTHGDSNGCISSSSSNRPPIVLDCRNSYESDVGAFDGAIPLNTTFFRESWPVLEELLRDTPRDAPVLTYCTGGIRCVKVNAYLQQKMGFTNTHRLAGGIIAYNRELEALRRTIEGEGGEGQGGTAENPLPQEGDKALPLHSTYRGVNYVFDERMGARVTEDVLTVCEQCADSCDTFSNCLSYACNVRFIQCGKCKSTYSGCCSKACQTKFLLAMKASEVGGGEGAPTVSSSDGLLSRKAQQSIRQPLVESRATHTTSTSAASARKFEHAYNSAAVAVGMGVGVAGTQQGGAAAGDETERMEALAQYCERQSASEPAVLSRLRAETLAVYAHSPGAARMLSDSLQGRVLAMLTTVSRAEQVLELGAFTGYSAICMALGLEGDLAAVATGTRRVLTCEPDPQARCIAQRHIDEAGLQGRIDLRDIKAAELLEELQQDPAAPMLDLVFLDADKKQYTTYLRTLMGDKDNDDETKGRVLLKDGALIVVDNTLWKGLVLEAEAKAKMTGGTAEVSAQAAGATSANSAVDKDEDKEKGVVSPRMRVLAGHMHAFNAFVAAEPRLQVVMLPLRDGLSVIRYQQQRQRQQQQAPSASSDGGLR